MSSAVTRAYMRGRMVVILTCFVLALASGFGFILIEADKARTSVRFGAVINLAADAAGDVIHHTLRLEKASFEAAMSSLAEMSPFDDPQSEADLAIRRGAERKLALIKDDLRGALLRLETAYQALERAATGDVGMLESRRITLDAGEATETVAGARDLPAIVAAIRGESLPAAARAHWGRTGEPRLSRDMKELITLANRLDLFSDYSGPTAARVFATLQTLANDRVRPALARTLEQLYADMIDRYAAVQMALVIVAIGLLTFGLLAGALIFLPMMRRVDEAQVHLQEANASLEQAMRAAEAGDRAKSEFLANMSHEIRTPMNGVLGMAELLARTELNERQRVFADVIVKSGNALLTIINDILDFSKIDAGQMAIHPEPFDLAEAIEDVATLMATRVAEKDLELIVRVDPKLPRKLIGDVGRIRQIVTNLVGNGVKFTERGHVLIDVSGDAADARVNLTIRIEDTGIGIPEEKLGTVFDKFAQVDGSSTRRHEGTGLGLAIASRLVALMDGSITAESTVGRGSTFSLAIPLQIDTAQAEPKPAPLDVTGARVLVVDDNPINRAILLEQLNSWGFECAAAESGMVGLAFLDHAASIGARVDCVVLDYQMPGLNGADVAHAMHAKGMTAKVPIILLTSVDQADVVSVARANGVASILNKPARSSALFDAIVTVLQKARQDRTEALAADSRDPAHLVRIAPVETMPKVPQKIQPALDVLVAEDNEVNQMVFSQILDGLGLTYRIAGNGRTAVEMHRLLKPRLILMDVSMPEMNGFEATAAIRAAERARGGSTPIIGITAHALKGDRERCLEAGMDDYLPKPVSPKALSAKIETWLVERIAAEAIAVG